MTKSHLQPSQLAEIILEERPLLRQKLTRALLCNPTDCQPALAEVIKFLTLAAENASGQLTPSIRIDLAWHEFILFTRTYLDFCEGYLGKLVHHEPSSDHMVNSQQYAQTLSRYRERFGEPPSEYWGKAGIVGNRSGVSASCGTCESEL